MTMYRDIFHEAASGNEFHECQPKGGLPWGNPIGYAELKVRVIRRTKGASCHTSSRRMGKNFV